MSNTTETRLTNLEARFDRFEALLIASLEGKAPAAAVVPAAPKVTRRTSKPQPKAAKCLTRKTRPAFVKAAPWASGLSTQVIASMCVEDPSLLPAGWAIGEGYRAMFA